jgi:hypothetical protein
LKEYIDEALKLMGVKGSYVIIKRVPDDADRVFRYISKDAVPSKSDLVNLENELT